MQNVCLKMKNRGKQFLQQFKYLERTHFDVVGKVPKINYFSCIASSNFRALDPGNDLWFIMT